MQLCSILYALRPCYWCVVVVLRCYVGAIVRCLQRRYSVCSSGGGALREVWVWFEVLDIVEWCCQGVLTVG